MEEDTTENLRMELRMVKELSSGLMERNTLVHGKITNSMAQESLRILKQTQRSKENGKKAKDFDGSHPQRCLTSHLLSGKRSKK